MPTNITSDISAFLRSSGIMTLATVAVNKPWVCTVYYSIDGGLNLYIVTDPHSVHGKQIASNRAVAFAVFDSRQKVTQAKQGVQGKGTIAMVKGAAAVKKALSLWHKANPGIEARITPAMILDKSSDAKIYKIRPTYLKYYNKARYGEKEYGVLNM